MRHINTLRDFGRQAADIEATYIVRGLKKSTGFPLQESILRERISVHFVSETDLQAMSRALGTVPKAIERIIALARTSTKLEPLNMRRACNALEEMPGPLSGNLGYAKGMLAFQDTLAMRFTRVLNQIKNLRTGEEKSRFDEQMSSIFEQILRSKEFMFESRDIVNEAHVARIKSLAESMEERFFFHVGLGDYLKHRTAEQVPQRLESEIAAISKDISCIREGIERAYAHNMRMIRLALELYSHIKWAMST